MTFIYEGELIAPESYSCGDLDLLGGLRTTHAALQFLADVVVEADVNLLDKGRGG